MSFVMPLVYVLGKILQLISYLLGKHSDERWGGDTSSERARAKNEVRRESRYDVVRRENGGSEREESREEKEDGADFVSQEESESD
jgi:hypothetical protein